MRGEVTKLVVGAALASVALAASACGSSRPAGPPAAKNGTITSSRLIQGGAVRCTATLPSSVPVGHDLGLVVRFQNLTSHPVDVQPAYGGVWAVVRSSDGTTYDTRIPLENSSGPPPRSIALGAGAATTERMRHLRVRWPGPLRITPGCDVSAAPPLRVDVTSPGPPAGRHAAVDAVVAAAGHLLDHCRPALPGTIPALGRVDAPNHSAPPLRTQCSAEIREEKSFDVVQVLVTSAPLSHAAGLDELYEQFRSVPGPGEVEVAWQFVVTKDGATPVAAADVEHSRRSFGHAPDFRWTSTGPGARSSGDDVCGSAGGGGGGLYPIVEFVSVCR
jgi:hypothetical protein